MYCLTNQFLARTSAYVCGWLSLVLCTSVMYQGDVLSLPLLWLSSSFVVSSNTCTFSYNVHVACHDAIINYLHHQITSVWSVHVGGVHGGVYVSSHIP